MEYKSKNVLRNLFSYYLYLWNFILFIIDLMPPFIRNFILRLMFKRMEKNVYIDYGVYFRFMNKIEIKSDVTISRGSKIFPSFYVKHSKIIIGNNVRIGPDVMIIDTKHNHKYIDLPDLGKSIIIEDNVWLGARSTILPGVTIAEGAVVAAGSIVTKNVPSYKIMAGVPAKIIKDREINEKN